MQVKLSSAEKAERKATCIERLRELCPPGTSIYTLITHVSTSGMSARLRVFVVIEGRIWNLTGQVCTATGYKWNDKHGDLVIGGCGFDRGYEVVSNLSYALHGHEDKGKAVDAARGGLPFDELDGENYRAGYSLRHERL